VGNFGSWFRIRGSSLPRGDGEEDGGATVSVTALCLAALLHGHGECEAENAVCFGSLPFTFWDARIGRASMVNYFKSMLRPRAGIVSVLDRCDGFVRILSCLDDFYGMEGPFFSVLHLGEAHVAITTCLQKFRQKMGMSNVQCVFTLVLMHYKCTCNDGMLA
jgi:hypothetical protein